MLSKKAVAFDFRIFDSRFFGCQISVKKSNVGKRQALACKNQAKAFYNKSFYSLKKKKPPIKKKNT